MSHHEISITTQRIELQNSGSELPSELLLIKSTLLNYDCFNQKTGLYFVKRTENELMNKIMMEKLKKSSLEALAEVSYLILHAM